MANEDDFNNILEVEDYVNLSNPKMVEADMNKAIEKVIVVSNVHEPSDWIDDCYVLMAKAQYYKQDYETAETTLQYFQEVFNPKNPYGRNYFKSPYNKKKLKKIKAQQKKEEKELKEKQKEEKAKEKKALAKQKAKERKNKAKQKEKETKQRAKDREKARKAGVKLNSSEPKSDPSATNVPPQKVLPKEQVIEEDIQEPKKQKLAKDETAYNEGLLWLAKTYIKRQNYFTAEFLLNKLNAIPNLNKAVSEELPSTMASVNIKQKKYTEAISNLQKAISVVKGREYKARYSFIIGQLYEKEKNNKLAYEFYKTAFKKSKNYKMRLMANMAMMKNELLSGQKNKEQTIASLNKMLKEDKYQDQKHIIYYTMAQIELSDENLEGAIENFQLSLQNNNSDDKLKIDVYYIIATQLFDKNKFYEAKLYYDSTLLVMNKNDKRFLEVDKRSKKLVDIAKNIDIILHQDTLLYLAELSGDDQKKEMLAYAKRIDETKQPAKPKVDLTQGLNITNVNVKNRFTEDFGKSSFFAYNKESKEKGKEEFVKKWGRNVQLQDYWRISSKSKDIKVFDDVVRDKTIIENQEIADLVESQTYKNLLKEVPQSPVQKKEVQEKLINAMFELGKLFRNVIEKHQNSIDILERMHTRFGPTKYELESYYYLVLNYRDIGNSSKADEYTQKLTKKYPESSYAKILVDPNYFTELKKEANKIDKYYEETYQYFTSGNYKIVIERIKSLKQQFGEENKYAAKVAIMNAMCIGNLEGKDAYVKALNDVVIAFPNTQEQLKAREILRFLTGDIQAFSTINDEESAKLYSFDETKPHFVAIVTYGLTEMEFVDVKISISEFNKQHFKVEKLQMSDAMLNKTDNSQVVVIKKFNNAKEAMKYFNKVDQLKADFIKGSVHYEVLPISQQNYLKMLGQYSSMAYRFFFEKNYKTIK
ncbi:MAG: hypothetical protein WAT79_14355 [Saprospiraceae bacterium]